MNIKHVVTVVLSGLGVAVLAGCPIYGDRDNRVCVGGDCYACDDGYYSSDCTQWSCNTDRDCPSGYVCNGDDRCVSGGADASANAGGSCTKPSDCPAGSTCGSDDVCHSGDCATSGCPGGYVCKLQNGVPACAATGSVPNTGTTSTCQSDAQCADAGAGAKCLTGSCVAAADQCADATQCGNGYACVNGACTPPCSATVTCPTGFACDTAKGVCTGAATACSSSSQCSGGTVCVDQHCVSACNADGTCGAGLVCVDGGCTPDERPVFTCATDGVQDACQAGSICLRHSCYIGCQADAGADACKNADKFNVCKTVTTSSGSHDVCGSATNLGTDCDPTQNKTCASPLICVDGYCK